MADDPKSNLDGFYFTDETDEELRASLRKWEERFRVLCEPYHDQPQRGYRFLPMETQYAIEQAQTMVQRLRRLIALRGELAHTPESKLSNGVPHGGRKWFDSDLDTLRRRQIVLNNPRMKSLSLCKVFDAATPAIPLPRDWKAELSVTTWCEAYKNQIGRKRIQKIISTDRRTGKPGSL